MVKRHSIQYHWLKWVISVKILARLSDAGKKDFNWGVIPTGLTKTRNGGQIAMIRITLSINWKKGAIIFLVDRFQRRRNYAV